MNYVFKNPELSITKVPWVPELFFSHLIFRHSYFENKPAVQAYFGRAKAACLCTYNRHL